MRLHRLEVTAFGPFAGTETVDFDTLGDAGLYLVHGPTGAGKSSILDAICFALYAAVPGHRAGSRGSLRSDHADPATVPRVVLELSAAGRRLRITRGPAFNRPKKRGTGETPVQPSVLLQELVSGAWVEKGTRIDEVALVIDDLLGLGLEQFVRVVLLPQGQFASFLRATPQERHGLLDRLFDTSRFTDVEDWLAGRRREAAAVIEGAGRALSSDLQRVDDLLSELDAEPPAHTDGDDPAGSRWRDLSPDEVGDALTAAVSRVTDLAGRALTEADAAHGRLDLASTALEGGRRAAELREAGLAARATLATLDAHADLHAEARTRLERARRSREVAGHLSAQLRSATDLESCTKRVGQRLRAARAGLGPAAALSDDVTLQQARVLAGQVGAATAGLVQAEAAAGRVVALGGRRATCESELRAQEARSVELTEATRAAASQHAELTQAVERLTAPAARLPAAKALVTRLERATRLNAAQAEDSATIGALEATLAVRTKAAVVAERGVLRLRQLRLDGMAGELAGQLADGEDCPVCGSAAHPRPASDHEAVDPDAIERAEQLALKAREARSETEHDRAVATSRRDTRAQELLECLAPEDEEDATTGRSGWAAAAPSEALAPQDVPAALAAARHDHEVARAAHAELPEVTDRLASLDIEREQARLQLAEVQRVLAGLRASSQASARDEREARADLTDLLRRHADQCPCDTTGLDSADWGGNEQDAPAETMRRHEAALVGLDDLVTALRAETGAGSALASADDELGRALADHDFADAAAARAAALPEDELAALGDELAEIQRRRTTAQAELDKAEVQASLEAEQPDLEALTLAHATARETSRAADRHQTLHERAQRDLTKLAEAVRQTLSTLAPAQAEHQLVQELAECTAGTSSDNTLRMRLSSFVLAARLEEVVRHANERLSEMSDGRYLLTYTDAKAARGARSGLGLRVLDGWTGIARETTTLSGGESFMASLALALGLGDAVRAEAGGLDLQTLFIDEGFGSLDDESLEQVMGVLDGLREGGRSVGIVSHVPELRQRIGAQVRVTKTVAGSHLAVHTSGVTAADTEEPAA